MGFWGLSSIEQLCNAVTEANNLIQKVQKIMNNVDSDLSRLSYSQRSELKSLGGQILIAMNKITPLIERDQSLMMASVPGFEGPVPAVTWMMWAMQWFNSFDEATKPYL